MKNTLIIFLSFFLISFLVFGNSLEVFFVQDDFVLIDKFSQGTLINDLKNITSFSDTHFRPIHYLYFVIFGNIFDKNYQYYHLINIVIHTIAGYCVFLLGKKLFKSFFSSFVAAFFFLVNSSHFLSLFWISANAYIEIGFILFCVSLHFWISRKFSISILFLLLSTLASESYFFGFLILIMYEVIYSDFSKNRVLLIKISALTFLAAIFRFIFLTPQKTFDYFDVGFSLRTFSVIKYYLLRILGFSELSGDLLISLVLLVIYGVLAKRLIDTELDVRKISLFCSIIVIGLFPFILLPNHLSPHYMSLSIFGLSLIVASVVKMRSRNNYLLLVVFLIISLLNINSLASKHWVIIKSKIAQTYIGQIEKTIATEPEESTIIFNDNQISSSLDAYLSLGGGSAIDFWFRDENIKYCFTEFESCDLVN